MSCGGGEVSAQKRFLVVVAGDSLSTICTMEQMVSMHVHCFGARKSRAEVCWCEQGYLTNVLEPKLGRFAGVMADLTPEVGAQWAHIFAPGVDRDKDSGKEIIGTYYSEKEFF